MRIKMGCSFSLQIILTKGHNIGPVMSVVEVFLQLGWHQICIGENSFPEHSLWLLQNLSFSDGCETKTNEMSFNFFIFDMLKGYDDNNENSENLFLSSLAICCFFIS